MSHSRPPTRSESSTDAVPLGPCQSEAQWIAASPDFEGSERLAALLLYLSDRSDRYATTAISQVDIARDVMGLGDSFDPSNDAHVRIEVSRLRTALAAFYSRLSTPRPRTLAIPKGGYRVEATPVHAAHTGGGDAASQNDPMICLGILCAQDAPSCRLGFELECELLNLISTSALTTDHLLGFSYASGKDIEQLAVQAERNGADVLAVAHVCANGGSTHAFVTLIRPRDRRLLMTVRLGAHTNSLAHLSQVQWISQGIAKEVLDPITGCAMKFLYQAKPDSRLSGLSKVFAFMASQDRQLLPDAYGAAQRISQTSDIAKALCIDMRRASYCFATDGDIHDLAGLCDAAEDLAERTPQNAWAILAMGYAGVSAGNTKLTRKAISATRNMHLPGAQKGDFDLLKALMGQKNSVDEIRLVNHPKENPSVFDTISMGISAVEDCGDNAASDLIVQSNHKSVFWVQAMQIAVHVQRNEIAKARENYCLMQTAHPDVQEYSKRAFTTMIPNSDVKDRILKGLDQAAV